MEIAEFNAFEWAAELVKDRNWGRVIVEGDAQNVVNALNGKLMRVIHTQVLVNNIKAAVSDLPSLSFSFCFREANYVAHRLAKWALASICSFIRLDSSPSCISDIVSSDLNT